MPKNYRQLTESIRERLNPEHHLLTKSFSDELATISYSDLLVFIRTAMKGVEPEYTPKSRDAGEKVKDHLSKELKDVTFRYQGSVMTDTHLKGFSDIDLLTISEKFYQADNYSIKQLLENSERRAKFYQSSIDKMQKEINASSYQGNALDDLRNNRLDSERILKDVYTVCDISKPKSIKIKNLSLNREVDIVITNWYDDIASVINDKGDFRGIQVYNKETHSRGAADFPFISIKRINERSSETNGRLKKMIRFMKNSKNISDHEIDLSSFDINAVCYDIEVAKYKTLPFYSLVQIIYNQLKSICNSKEHSDNVISVDGREYIFKGNEKKLQNLQTLLIEVEAVYLDYKNSIRL
ncbi:MAG TPA: nucleotidyltransferase domain-containing protein [Chitinophagaceae bacterium]